MIPKDIETTIQWRVRHQLPSGAEGEVVRVVNEVQARSIAQRLSHLNPVLEARLIAVGEWGDPDEVTREAEAVGEEPDGEPCGRCSECQRGQACSASDDDGG